MILFYCPIINSEFNLLNRIGERVAFLKAHLSRYPFTVPIFAPLTLFRSTKSNYSQTASSMCFLRTTSFEFDSLYDSIHPPSHVGVFVMFI